ncbi:MAG: DUF456 domain-containing protein [Gemmatimonadaceae bacterium]
MSILILGVICLLSLLMVPLGLPGIWVMIAAAIGHDMLVPASPIGWWGIGGAIGLGVVAEYLEFALAGRYARKYGGSRRAGWGALVGGFVGAFMGVPVPVIGSLIGAFAGAFVGALVAEYTRRESTAGTATRVATGALIGRVVAAGMKTGIATAIAAVIILAALR